MLQTAGKDFRASMYHPCRPGRTLAWFPTVYDAWIGLHLRSTSSSRKVQ